jgi:murein DD-endopeptidase MepM/ murein hydrolase activator NlpD
MALKKQQKEHDMNELQVIDQSGSTSVSALIFDPQKLQAMQTMAKAMSEAVIAVPAHFRGKSGDCLAVVMQAAQWGMNPFAVAQKTHVVGGALGYEAQLVNAVVQNSGAVDGRFHYEYRGEGANVECRVGAVIRGEKEVTWGEWLSAATVTTKNSPLWKTNPKQQLGYLQVKNWARAFAPGAILGVYSSDELAEPMERDITSEGSVVRDKPTAKPAYDQEQFSAYLPKWRELIQSGKKTTDDIIAIVRTKATLTAAQVAEIQAITKAESQTFAQVAEALNMAGDIDTLDAKADLLIKQVADEAQRTELTDLYHVLRIKLEI